MEEIQSPEGLINGGGALAVTSLENVASKRQRRPSVRLGDIGDQPYETQVRRSGKQWKHHSFDQKKEPNASGKASKTRALMNLSSAGGGADFDETLDGDEKMENLDSVAIGSWKVRDTKKRGSNATKRVRSIWASKIDGGGGEGDEKYSGGEDVDDGSGGFEIENSESPMKEQSPNQSLAVDGNGKGNEREVLFRSSIRGRDRHDAVEMSGPSDNDARDWKSVERNGNGGRGRYGEDGVRIWLNSLGLGRYAPVFEIHEVDDEVLPLLTLEDLKDMGVNAVGSRRKMFCAIQKLGKGFS